MIEYDFNPHKLSDETLLAIGLTTCCAAHTENIIEMAIHAFLDVDLEYGMAITTHMNMPQRLSALRTTGEIRINDLNALDELDEIIKKIEVANKQRNKIIHNSWCREPESGIIFMIEASARTTVAMEIRPVNVDEIRSDATLIYEAGIELMKFLIKYRFNLKEPPPSRFRGHKTAKERKKRNKKSAS